MILKFPEETQKALHNWIHDNYGKKSDLMRDEYNVSIDMDLENDVFIGAGSTIQIIIKYPPDHPKFHTVLKSVFSGVNIDLRKLRRSKALVKKSDVERWFSLAYSNMEVDLPRLKRNETYMSQVRTRLLSQVQVTDKKTGRDVTITIENGNAFNAIDEALRILFGERV